jgi:hypothetical protein
MLIFADFCSYIKRAFISLKPRIIADIGDEFEILEIIDKKILIGGNCRVIEIETDYLEIIEEKN